MTQTTISISAVGRVFSTPGFLLLMLGLATFTLATRIEPSVSALHDLNPRRSDPLASLFGDGRKLFAKHFYTKADVYFHSGFYPTMFDNQESHRTAHMAEDAGVTRSENTGDEDHFLGAPKNWIDAHGRKHFPSVHTHLGEDSPDGKKNSEREILPWLKFSARMDPNLIETYTVAAYWLRRTGSSTEAEAFLRDGLRFNPSSAELHFELGRCRYDAQDRGRARNLLERAWTLWLEAELKKPAEKRDVFLGSQIALHLARLESVEGRRTECIAWLERALPLRSDPTVIRKRIEEVKAGQSLLPESVTDGSNP